MSTQARSAQTLSPSPTIVAAPEPGEPAAGGGALAGGETPLFRVLSGSSTDTPRAPLAGEATLPEPGVAEIVEAPRPVLEPGRVLGDYRLEAPLGEGASASVWRATDLRLHMPIALKLFEFRGRAGRAVLEAVMREARAASRVVSDFIIRVKDAGVFEDVGLGFIAMELCAALPDGPDAPADGGLVIGRALDRRLPATTEEALRVLAQAAHGVADAHQEGVFHRDVKPANILVRPGSGRAQITDFGLTVAELGATRAWGRSPDARRRVVLGTPDYMAPEAAAGLPAHLDPVRDRRLLTGLDVYGLGATLYAVLAGHPPLRRDNDEKVTVRELLERARTSAPPPLDALGATRLPVSRQVARVVAKAMARNPEDRYLSARALAQDLEAILAHRPTSLDEADRALRLRLYLRRNRLRLGAALSVAVMLLAVAGTLVTGRVLQGKVRAAEAEIARLEEQRARSRAEAARWEAEARDAAARAQAALDRESEARAIIAETETDLDAARRRALAMLRARDLARDEAAAWKKQAEEWAAARDAAKADAAGWKARAEATAADLDEALADAARWKGEASRLGAERDGLQAELAQARSRVEALEADLADARARAARAEERAARLTARLRAAERQRDLARGEVQRLKAASAGPAHPPLDGQRPSLPASAPAAGGTGPGAGEPDDGGEGAGPSAEPEAAAGDAPPEAVHAAPPVALPAPP